MTRRGCATMEFINTNEKIPASEWFKLVVPMMREGYQLKICPQGDSMIPFLRGGRDEAVLVVLDEDDKLLKNDIVLYPIENGVHVLHRIYKINKHGIYTLGDSQIHIEGPMQRKDIIAVAAYIIRKGRKIERSDRVYNILVSVWRWLRPYRRTIIVRYFQLKSLINRRNRQKRVSG